MWKAQREPQAYSKHLLSYFDILGFREMVKDQPPVEIERALRLFDKSVKPFSIEDKADVRCYRFSDHVARAIPLEVDGKLKEGAGDLIFELYDVALVQAQLAN